MQFSPLIIHVLDNTIIRHMMKTIDIAHSRHIAVYTGWQDSTLPIYHNIASSSFHIENTSTETISSLDTRILHFKFLYYTTIRHLHSVGTSSLYLYVLVTIRTDNGLFPRASYQIRKIAGFACAGKAGNVFPATAFKENRGWAIPACITARAWPHLPWCTSGSGTCGGGKTIPAFPAHAQPANLRIWQEAHGVHPV